MGAALAAAPARAQAAGHFKSQIVAVEVPGKKGPTAFDKDEANRPDTTLETLAKLKPAFRPDGTITAGNAPGLNDAAAAIENAVGKAIDAGNRTGDIFSPTESGARKIGTKEMGDAIASVL